MWSQFDAVAAVNTVAEAVPATVSCSSDATPVFPSRIVVPVANPDVDPTVNTVVPAVAAVLTVVLTVVGDAPEHA
jgi:hypothetical protein